MKRGFTLIEVLIVVIILGILATIAIPQFARVTSRARLAEAWANLAAIRTAESVYYMERESYSTNLADLDIDLAGTHFTYTINSDNGFTATATGSGDAGYPNTMVAWINAVGVNHSAY